MVLPLRTEVHTPRTLRRSASILLAVALFTAGCTDSPPRNSDSVEASAGASEPISGPDAGAGGQRGHSGEPLGGMFGGSPDAGPPMLEPEPEVVEPEPEPEPEVVDPEVDPPVVEEDGLPCDVKKLLRARCQTCHSNPPIGGALVSLLTHADLTARSKTLPSVTVAVRSLQRMNDTLSPMPPAPANHATSAELATLQGWLAAGLPTTKCEDEPRNPSTNPYDAPSTCSSGSYWTANDTGAPWMMPGAACITCHRQYFTRAPLFTVAGTVFATAHEPDKCHGVPAAAGANVIITDATGKELTIPVSSRGNFGVILNGLALPYRAKVVVGSSERVMLTPQSNGDCNACHTQAGSQGALGRLILPAAAAPEGERAALGSMPE
jgi:hypothetical protein